MGEPLQPRDPRQIGKYVVLRRLGRGGMGTVYLGRTNDTLVAVKVIRSDLIDDPLFARRFRREVEAAKQVPAFCTARVLDADAHADPPHLVTEFIPGPTLDRAVRGGGPVARRDQTPLAVGIAAALDAIHGAHVVHRDLKPSNVLLSPLGPRVIDFGIARALDATTTLTGRMVGTPAFMAPEQYTATYVGTPADIFAWGAVLVFASMGQPPFGTGPSAAVMYRIIHDEPDLTALAADLRDLVHQAMAKDPDARPTSRQLLDALIDQSGLSTNDQPSPATAVLDHADETVQSRMPLAELSATGEPASLRAERSHQEPHVYGSESGDPKPEGSDTLSTVVIAALIIAVGALLTLILWLNSGTGPSPNLPEQDLIFSEVAS